MERLITELEEKALRLVHHEHQDLSIEAAAKEMELTPKEVQRLLDRVEEVAPQLFPIVAPGARYYGKHRMNQYRSWMDGMVEQKF